MRLLSFIIVLFIVHFSNGQIDFVAFDKIRASTITPSKRNTVIVTDEKIYFLQNSDFKLLDSIDIVQVQDRVVSDVFLVHSNMVGVRFGTTNPYMPDLLNTRMQFYEYPQDSIFLYTIDTKKLFSRLSGNCYVAASAGNKSLMGYNDYYEYTNEWGAKLLGSSKGEFVFFEGEQQKRIPANGPVIGKCFSPSGDQLALMYYDYDSVVVEFRNTTDLSVLVSTKIKGKSSFIKYSDDGKWIILFDVDEVTKHEEIKVLDLSNMSIVEPSAYEADYISGKLENGALWTIEENSIKEIDFRTGKIKTEVWANLTDFADLQTFYKINEFEIVVVGNKRALDGTFSRTWGVEKINLRDLKVFADQTFFDSSIDSTKLFDNTKPFLQNNYLMEGQKQFSRNLSLMLVHANNNFQIWDVDKRLKIHDLFFDENIRPFLSANGEQVLIFKAAKGKSYDDFYLEVFDVKMGVLRSRAYIDQDYDFLDYSTGEPFQNEDNQSLWYFVNHYGASIFEINTESLEIRNSREREELGSVAVSVEMANKVPQSNLLHLHLRYGDIADAYDHAHSILVKEKSGHYIYNCSTGTIQHKKEFDYFNLVLPTFDQHFLVTDTTSKTFQVVDRQNKMVQSRSFPEDVNLNHFKWFIDSLGIYLASDHEEGVLLYSYLPNLEFNSRMIIKGNFSDLEMLRASFLCSEGYSDSKNWFTYYPERKQQISWQANQGEAKTTHTINLQKNILYIDNYQKLDLSTLSIQDAEKRKSFNQWYLIKSQNALVSVKSEGGWNNEPSFIFVEARDFDNFDSILWVSNKLKHNEFLTPTISSIQADGKIASLETNSFGANPDYFLIDFNSHDLKKVGKDQSVISNCEENQIPIGLATQNVEFEGKSYYAREYLSMARFYPEKDLIIAIASKIYIWEKGNSSPIKVLPFSGFYSDNFIVEGGKLYLISRNRIIDVFDLNTYKKLLTIEVVGEDENPQVVAYTPEGYFKAPKGQIRNLHFVKSGVAYPLLNYELVLNRPDIVCNSTGFSDQKTIQLYQRAYQKRLERNGIKELSLESELDVPTVQISNKVAPLVSSPDLELELIFSSNADSYTVFDNGVALFSENLKGVILKKIEIQLHNGLNSISVIAKSKEGVESDPAFVEVNNTEQVDKGSIYFVGLGVSNYKDSAWNLNFADDDVRSLANFLGNDNYFHKELMVDTLVNTNATRANFLALKSKLMTTSVNDIVIVSLSGHGMLDDDKNFYFGTHDIDFSNPKEKGLSYDEIQSILDGIPARRKLLLMDACHSGEVNEGNKNNWTTNNNQPGEEGQKGGDSESNGNEDFLDEESFEIMKNTFQDLDRGNGTFVISASGAKEFAIESKGNGIFTLSFINAIADWEWNDKGAITISDLQKEINRRVSEETNGQQKPTSRAENVEWNWVFE